MNSVGRPPGGTKAGGRVAGTPNRVTMDLIQTLRDKGFDPAIAIIETHQEALKQYKATEEVLAIVNEEQDSPYTDSDEPRVYVRREIRGRSAEFLKIVLSSAAELMQYTHPKRKAVEHKADLDNRAEDGKMKQVMLYIPSNAR